MIKKIFYSLVLFPYITYEKDLGNNYFLSWIEEIWHAKLKVFFYKENKIYSLIFTHIDYKSDNSWLDTKNWNIFWDEDELLKLVHNILNNKDKKDFHFFKSKEFYYKIPFWVVLNITSKCNLFCDYCFNDYDYPLKTRNIRETLKLDNFKEIVDKLYDAGTRDIIVTWWEPFMCEFFWDLLDYISAKNIFIRINTNWTLLNETNLKKLNSNYSLQLMISMHEFNNKDYFELNKKWASNIYWISNLEWWKNKFEKKVEDIKNIDKYKNISYDFLTILTPKNILYLEKIYDYVIKNFNINDWHFFRLFSTNTTKWISREMITLAIHKIYKLNKKYWKNYKIVDAVPFCVTKNTELASQVVEGELSEEHNVKTIITAEGNVQIMSAFDMHLWNIFESSIEKIWQSDFVQKKLTNWFLPRECYICTYKEKCRWWSRMDANIFNWAYDALDPLCNLENKKTI